VLSCCVPFIALYWLVILASGAARAIPRGRARVQRGNSIWISSLILLRYTSYLPLGEPPNRETREVEVTSVVRGETRDERDQRD
jgi:uncharacterized RDD family membrane protein YckC